MTKEEFIHCLNAIKSNSEQTAKKWIEWAEEQEDYDSCQHTLPENEYATADMFLDEFASMFDRIAEKHVAEISSKMIGLDDIPACPYPWDIMSAADYLAGGVDLNKITEMETEGVFEDGSYRLPRKMSSEEGEHEAPTMQM